MKFSSFENIDAGVRSPILISVAAVLVSFPYVVYVITSVIYPDFTKMDQAAPKIGIGLVIGTMVLAGYLVGANHRTFLTCEDFDLSGQHVPADCRQQ